MGDRVEAKGATGASKDDDSVSAPPVPFSTCCLNACGTQDFLDAAGDWRGFSEMIQKMQV
uniref:Uncharacterized protein n=1 Tax=Peronospora matthiolae TaxID=2874970 RepID=A0AAV1UIV8_9STRA